ncbi:MAG: YciI family protein [Bacteroidota bacterium]
MNHYLILIREDLQRMTKLSEADFQAEIQEYVAWVEEMTKTGNYLSGDPLEAEGRYILKDQVRSDGPFVESKEAISGYVIIKAVDMDAAIQLAQQCPIYRYGGAVELRAIMQH